MNRPIHLERVTSAGPAAASVDAITAAALVRLEAATEDRPLRLEALLREADADGVLLLARDGGPDGDVVGFASARLLVDEAHVMRLAVDGERRREGIGRALLDRMTMWAEGMGAVALVLEVRAGNEAALHLYGGAGLTREGCRPRYYPDGEDALLLRRPLREG
jgi:ribosomal-protein-alanine N-acetyltransferase